MVKPGGADHEDAPKVPEEDYDYESTECVPSLAWKTKKTKKTDKQQRRNCGRLCEKFFDYTITSKGETAVLTVEKKFGDGAVATAQETIKDLMANKDPEIEPKSKN